MVAQQRGIDEPMGSYPGNRPRGSGAGTLLFMTACGIGLGLLTAPQTGRRTRRLLRQGLTAVGGEVAGRLGEVQDRLGGVRKAGARTGRRLKHRLAHLRENADDRWEAMQDRLANLEERLERFGEDEEDEEASSGFMTALLGLAAGAGLAYLVTADAAAPARSKVQEVATDLRRKANNRWEELRRSRTGTGTGTRPDTSSFAAEEM